MNSDFVTGTCTTADTEAKIGTLNVPGGAKIRQIQIANRAPAGAIYAVRLDYAGIKTPKKFTLPAYYEATGTEVEYQSIGVQEDIDVYIPLPSNVSTVDIYATANTNTTLAAIGLVWE